MLMKTFLSRSCLKGIRAINRPVHLAVLSCGILLSPVFRAQSSQLTNVQTVFIIVMENKGWDQIHGNADCPYINNTLLPMASRAERYFTPYDLQPSEPNYIWLEAGTNFGILDDELPAINHISSTNHLVTQLEKAGISWKTYQESYNPNDDPRNDNRPYVARHNPFVFFDDVANDQARLASHVRPYSELAADLQRNAVARYNFITPNLTNDMHSLAPGSGSKEKQGDDWLARELPAILSSATYSNKGALFITWDEDSNGPIGLILLSPLAKWRGYSNNIDYTHSSLLRTLQEIFGVGPLLGDAANATDLSDLFLNDRLRLSALRDAKTGVTHLTLTGLVAGSKNVIQTSSNLFVWLPLKTNVATTNALIFTDTADSDRRPRFYRALEFR